ncbi:MAG: carboxypeptidase regulatory-like domain-containing protein [Nitrospinae bacterium]|nr:carboxypeptidase regulatory-like domain-containing protein [Nitrospinota bacterium]
MKKIVLGVMAVSLAMALGASTGFAGTDVNGYKEGSAGTGSISGSVSLKGTAMAPIIEDLSKGKNVEFCSKHPEAKDGMRARVKVLHAGGKIQNAVVIIEDLKTGKPWGDIGKTSWDFKDCDIFPKMTVVRRHSKEEKKAKSGLAKITNQDTDVLHNPHGYAVKGASRGTLFNKPLPSKGSSADVTKTFKFKKEVHFFLQCDQHNYMEADARILKNPYYAMTAADGSFKIEGIPAGKYKVTAWQPYVGESTIEVTVGAGEAKADFTLTAE